MTMLSQEICAGVLVMFLVAERAISSTLEPRPPVVISLLSVLIFVAVTTC
jgi:hypothetical protein